MTGTAEMVAQEVQTALEAAGHQAEIKVMDGLDASVFRARRHVPHLHFHLRQRRRARQRAGAVRQHGDGAARTVSVTYGVIALGDITYKDTFCHGRNSL